MRLQKKSLSKLALTDLLRRRKTDLEAFLRGNGIVTYALLESRCESMGVSPPTPQQFADALGNPTTPQVSSPTEGVVVVESPPLPAGVAENSDISSMAQDGENPSVEPVVSDEPKKKRVKKTSTAPA